jgi:hypothetical protein
MSRLRPLHKAGLAQPDSARCIAGLSPVVMFLLWSLFVLLGKDAKEVIMGSLFKLTGILLLLSLLVLPVTGCDNPPWDSGMTLVLKVDTPEDGATVTTPTVTVSGRVTGTQSATAKIKVNDEEVFLKEGKFSTLVTLNEGANVINIDAVSGVATLKEQVSITYVPAK